MRKRSSVLLCISVIALGMISCATESNSEDVTPTIAIEHTDATVTPNPTTKVFKEKEEDSFSKVVTKTDGLCEQLEQLKTPIAETYNKANRMLSVDVAHGGLEGFSYFCVDETTGVIYFVNQSEDDYLYRIKDGEIALALAMPVKELYPYQGVIYFMVDDCYGKYELQEMKSGDIYCYTPASGAVELVYEAGEMEHSEKHKLFVDERGVYFSYEVKTENGKEKYFYQLPFGATEPVVDTEETVTKGWKEYKFSYAPPEYQFRLESRTANEDGKKEHIELSVNRAYFCVIGNMLYSAEKMSISCTNLETGETIYYDFVPAMEKIEIGEDLNSGKQMIKGFIVTEDALWVTTNAILYRMDFQSGEITCADIWHNNNFYSLLSLYTDGKEIYGLNCFNPYDEKSKRTWVRILTDTMDATGEAKVRVKFLTK